jgi:hypothetical protein
MTDFFDHIDASSEEPNNSSGNHQRNGLDEAWHEPPEDLCLSLRQWVEREIRPDDYLLGELLSTTSRAMLVSPTGLGKTNFSMALGLSIAMGQDFLHWRAGRSSRVLYIDGEMSRSLLKRRIQDAIRRASAPLDTNFFAFCRDDFTEMQPLNTEGGQEFVEALIKRLGGIDFVIFDNIQSLLVGDMKEELPWQETLPWIRQLTSRRIGQLWVHHTGHDETHSYGTKTREWQLDTVIILDRDTQNEADIAFTLRFPKARQRTPQNRADFIDAKITLSDDVWISNGPAPKPDRGRSGTQGDYALSLLHDAIAKAGEVPADVGDHLPPNARCVKLELWREYCRCGGLADEGDKESPAARQAFYRVRKNLLSQGRIRMWQGWVCPISKGGAP